MVRTVHSSFDNHVWNDLLYRRVCRQLRESPVFGAANNLCQRKFKRYRCREDISPCGYAHRTVGLRGYWRFIRPTEGKILRHSPKETFRFMPTLTCNCNAGIRLNIDAHIGRHVVRRVFRRWSRFTDRH